MFCSDDERRLRLSSMPAGVIVTHMLVQIMRVVFLDLGRLLVCL